MTAKKEISRSSAGKNDGKKGPGDQLQHNKMTAKPIDVKYTFVRSKDDIAKLEKLRQYLKQEHPYSLKTFNTDSEIYREMPDLYLNAVKQIQDLQLAIDELTAKLDQLEDLRSCFCRIFELCEVKK